MYYSKSHEKLDYIVFFPEQSCIFLVKFEKKERIVNPKTNIISTNSSDIKSSLFLLFYYDVKFKMYVMNIMQRISSNIS